MDRHVFLAAQPWLHQMGGVGDVGGDTQHDGMGQGSADALISALGYEYEVTQLFSGLCCPHLPVSPDVAVTPATHHIFFEARPPSLDPGQLQLQLWVLGHLLDHTPSLCGVFDGRPYHIDHTQCTMLAVFSGCQGSRSSMPAFLRMSFQDVALQLWYPPGNTPTGIGGDGTAGQEDAETLRLEQFRRALQAAVAQQPFRRPASAQSRLTPHASPVSHSRFVDAAASAAGDELAALSQRLIEASERGRVEVLAALQRLVKTVSVEGVLHEGMADQEECHMMAGLTLALERATTNQLQPAELHRAAKCVPPLVAEVMDGLDEHDLGLVARMGGTPTPINWQEEMAGAELWREQERLRLLVALADNAEEPTYGLFPYNR